MANLMLTYNLKGFVGQTVGYVKVNKSWVHHNNSFECAAWWEDSRVIEGVYPLVLRVNRFVPKNLYLEARFDAEVVDAYLPAMMGGVAFADYSKNRIGEKRAVFGSFDIVEAMTSTGRIPGEDKDFVLNPFLWDSFIESARKSMRDSQEYLENCFSAYLQDGDGNYNRNISSVAHASENVSELAFALEKMLDAKKKISETEYLKELHVKNTSWAA